MRALLVGHGRMGRLVESLCPEYGVTVCGVVDRERARHPSRWPDADVAIDFSVAAAVPENVRHLAERKLAVVIGTTGWQAHEADVRAAAAGHGIGVVAAPNFALGVHLFAALVGRAAELFRSHPSYGAWIHELHHAAKRDAPSGTALMLTATLGAHGYAHPVDVAATRAGAIPGTHTVGFDGAGETITLTHAARDRTPFARGALEAARWVRGRRGWFGMSDVLGL